MQFGDFFSVASATCRSCACVLRQCCKMHLAAAANCIKIVFSTRRLHCVYQVSQLTTGNTTIYIYLTLFLSLSSPPSLTPSSSCVLPLAVHCALINWNNFGVLHLQLATGNWQLATDCIRNEEALLRYIIDSIFLFAFMLALIFHSHQTEATYRLDFIWKLQATGEL